MSELEAALVSLYGRFTDRSIVDAACDNPTAAAAMIEEIDGPFLISPNAEYNQSQPRIVIVGQENNGWIGPYKNFLESKTIADAFRLYDDFDLERSYKSTFFQYFASIRDSLVGTKPERRRSVLWLNLFKFNQGMNPQMIYSTYRRHVLALQGDVFQREVALLRPDVLVFLTGPYYDEIIEEFFPQVTFEQIDGHPTRHVARVVHKELPTLSFRTYHPSYLNRFRARTAHCVPAIISAIRGDAGPD